MSANVIIRKQHIKVHTSDEQEALKLRQVINDSLQYEVVRMMEKVFEKYERPSRYVNIDKIELDLGSIHSTEFERQFVGLVETKLTQELSRQLSGSGGVPTWQENTGFAGINETTAIPDSSFQFSSPIQQDIAALLHFLEHGIFPWWYKEGHFKSPDQLLQNLTDPDWETLLRLVVTLKRTRSSVSMKRIVQRLFQYLPEIYFRVVIDQLIALEAREISKSSFKDLLGKKEELQRLLKIQDKEFHQAVASFLLTSGPVEDAGMIDRFVEEFKSGRITEGQVGRGNPGDEKLTNLKDVRLENEGIYIDNAGLVLLNPFLPQLFSATALVNDAGLFPDAAHRHKAAVLLYYIQSGNDDYNEWEMVFNKILCGIPSEDVLPGGLSLSVQDKLEAIQMLQAVVNYWEALKGASIDSVRNTFLLRPGKITWKENYWLLQVERTGVDILLEKLPWGFGTIKFPWLSHLIHTEW